MIAPVGVNRARQFDSVGMSSLVCVNGRSVLPSALASDDQAWSLQVVAPTAGELHTLHDDLTVRAGEAVLRFNPAEPVRVAGECPLLLIEVPAELARPVFGADAPERPLLIGSDSALLAPMLAFAAQILSDDSDQSRLTKYYVERLMQEMVLALMTDESGAALMPASPDPYRQALNIIHARSSDPALSTDEIAAEVRLSRRQLERLFQRNETTVGGEVRKTRLDQAATMLQSDEYQSLSVDQIAGFVGFSGGSALARAMATEGRPAPSKIRRPSSAA